MILGQLKDFVQFQAVDHIGFIGVKFKAQGFQNFVPDPIHQFTEKITDIKDVWGNAARLLEENIANLTDNAARVACIETFLLKQLIGRADPMINYWTRLILESNGNIRIGELASQTKISARQLERRFLDAVGISPGSFARISRMQHSLVNIELDDHSNLTALGLTSGYYDQSHFIKEVDKFTGMTPKNVRAIAGCYGKTAFL